MIFFTCFCRRIFISWKQSYSILRFSVSLSGKFWNSKSKASPSRADTGVFRNESLLLPILLTNSFSSVRSLSRIGLQLLQSDSISLIKLFAKSALPFLFW